MASFTLAADAKSCSTGIDFLGMFGDPIGTMMHMVANAVMAGALGMFAALQSSIGSYNNAASAQLDTQTHWVVVYLAVGSLLFAAVKMALDRRGEAGQTALKGMLRVLAVTAVSSVVIGWFADLMEDFGNFLLKKSLDNVLNGIDCTDDVPAALLLVIACLLIIAAIIHTILLWIRLGVMIVLMGTFPMAAAASMTQWGTSWWRKHIGWMVAWLLYKPTVGLVMYAGSVMIYNAQGDGSGDAGADAINTQIAGMGVLLLSAIALPALMRLVVPATAGLGSDSTGSAAMGVAGGVASGAKSISESAIKNISGPSGSKDSSEGGGDRPSGSQDGHRRGGEGDPSQGGSGGGPQDGGAHGGGRGGAHGGGGGGARGGGRGGAHGGGGGEAGSAGSVAAAGLSGILTAATVAAQAGKSAAGVARSAVDERSDPEEGAGGRHDR